MSKSPPVCNTCHKPLERSTCYNCNGKGTTRALLFFEKDCQTCQGRGWVLRCPDEFQHSLDRIRKLSGNNAMPSQNFRTFSPKKPLTPQVPPPWHPSNPNVLNPMHPRSPYNPNNPNSPLNPNNPRNINNPNNPLNPNSPLNINNRRHPLNPNNPINKNPFKK